MNRQRIFPRSLKQSGQISKHVNSAIFFISMIGYIYVNHLKTSPTLFNQSRTNGPINAHLTIAHV